MANLQITVWARPGLAHTAEYALKISGKILRYYEKFFGIEYPLPKMDMIALPDFNAGAMENWGLITYRETAMLYDEKSSSIANKQRVATVVAHELAHQWFGNLVSPKWWDDLWLNEGFATYVEYIGVGHVEPKWQMQNQFVIAELQSAFSLDALESSHQISIPVTNPDEISEIFDGISYSKGASIIRMMGYFLTEDVFLAGLQRYLRALKYSNAEQSDLWTHLTDAQRLSQQQKSEDNSSTIQAANKQQELVDVGSVMNSWTLQTGYPLVTLTRTYADGGAQAASAKLEQVRFEPNKFMKAANQSQEEKSVALPRNDTTGQRWEIPITYTWKSDQKWEPKTRLWLRQNDSGAYEIRDKSMLPASNDDWMIVNVNQVGYYRVNYDERNWRLLIDQLNKNHTQILTTNRAQLLDDIFELAKCSVLDYKFAMEATRYLKSERDYMSWDAVLKSFAYIDEMLERTSIYGEWKDYVAGLIEPYYGRYKDLDWTTSSSGATDNNNNKSRTALDQDDVLEQYNQQAAISWACQVNDHCIEKAKSVFRDWKTTNKNRILPSLRSLAYCTAIANGNKEDWEFLWQAYGREQNASERDKILRSLGCSRELWILSRYLEWIFNKAKPIRRQDGATVFSVIAKNNYGRDIAFNFLRDRWQMVKEFYGKSSFSFGHLIRSVSTSMNTQIELQHLKNFYELVKSDVGSGKRTFQNSIEEVESNVEWRKRNYNTLEEWLQNERSRKASSSA